ncbi:MAG: copper chaperone PCu(A)C [Bauldia sp.]|nr:MAG: copper chaperone PCu(A)C [Bauldia sp.]
MLRTFFAALAVTAALGAPATAHEVKIGTLELTGLWARATPPNAPAGGGFLTITNTGDAPDRLIAVSSPDVGQAEIHEMKVADGVMTMRPLENGPEIPAHGTVTLAPGGIHLMFIGLKAPFVAGGELPVTLTFEKAGPVETFLHIEPIGAKGPGGAGHADKDQGGMTMGTGQ